MCSYQTLKLWDIQWNAAFFLFLNRSLGLSTTEPEDPLDNTARSKTYINSSSLEQKYSFYTDFTNESRQHYSRTNKQVSSFSEKSDI